MILRTARHFSFKPSSRLNFVDKKCLLMESAFLGKLEKFINYGVVSVPVLFFYRIVKNYSSMGWLNFIFSSTLFVGSAGFVASWQSVLSSTVKRIYLLEDGKTIEIQTYGIKFNPNIVRISDIINPEDNLESKIKIKYFNSWIIETKQNKNFFMVPDSSLYESEIIKEILKGQEIDLQEQDYKKIKEEDKDVIDI